MKTRPNGAFRALIEEGAATTADTCVLAGRKKRPTYSLNGRDMNASRAVWWIAHGDPGPLKVLHRCGNEQCLNVGHLYLGTTADNARDTSVMGRCGNQVVSWADALRIAERYRPGKAGHGNGNSTALAAEFGVSQAAIRLAVKRVHRFASTEENQRNMTTLTDVEAVYGVSHLDHLDKEAAIPVVTNLAFQGDVAIIRRDGAGMVMTPIPATGYPVVRGENGGNTHALFGPGFFHVTPNFGLDLGVLNVPVGEQVLLSHPEHGGLLIQPGTYVVRRQREQADEIRLVQD